MFICVVGLAVLSCISGMLGIGAAFAAIPFLSFFMADLVNEVQPLSLLLNGVSAGVAGFGFSQSGYIDWSKAIILAVVMTIFSPVGAYLVRFLPEIYIWYIYLASVAILAYKMLSGQKSGTMHQNMKGAVVVSVPIAILSGFLGVGPGFLLVPVLIIFGFSPKLAAGINAIAVTPPSFSALWPHWETAHFDMTFTTIVLVAGAVSSFLGAKISSHYLPDKRVKQIFGALIVAMTAYKIFTLIDGQ